MIAAVLEKPKTFIIKETAIPNISNDEIKIRVEGCGICASSIPVWEGREWFNYPMEGGSPGHEGWGIVEEAGTEITKVKKGDRVAFLSFHAYAEYDVAKESSFVKLPPQLANQPFPGEPLGCALNIFNRSDISKDDVVAIIGIGFLGALLCQLAKERGAKVIAISRRSYSLGFAEKYGADEVIPLTSTWEVANKVAELTGNAFCSRVIEATGKQEAIDIATEIVAEGGKMIIAGYHQDGLRQVNLQKWNWKGIDVINAHERDPRKYLSGMQDAVEAVVNGQMDPELLYTDILSIDELNKGFEMTRSRPDGFMKALIKF
ncbi:L-iditol 2-dehydrogenase [Segetibacter sp. 3557_3]|uniref:MDR/zinc-dependent alcohol dehydrogenase-like family protein n=1 Tax=Segetibacter sp. 3557_3 TaxID=2547429 RepID=UPI0010588793|nr:zinc-binding dehydrogenase [Segetibacter sp. 3557_3]TDH25250.1 L-iditol 2-dehydrogenase [Segetibacter sp. 3557_3]